MRQDFVCGAGLSAIETITTGEVNTDPDTSIQRNSYNFSRTTTCPNESLTTIVEIFFRAKKKENKTPDEHWRKLVFLEKNCEFKVIKQEDLMISKFIISITDKKLRKKTHPQENTKPETNHGPTDPRQLRKKTETINDAHSTCGRKGNKSKYICLTPCFFC